MGRRIIACNAGNMFQDADRVLKSFLPVQSRKLAYHTIRHSATPSRRSQIRAMLQRVCSYLECSAVIEPSHRVVMSLHGRSYAAAAISTKSP